MGLLEARRDKSYNLHVRFIQNHLVIFGMHNPRVTIGFSCVTKLQKVRNENVMFRTVQYVS